MTVTARWISETIEDSEVYAQAEPDLRFPKYAYLDVIDEPDIHVDVKLRVYFKSSFSRYVVDSVQVLRRPKWSFTVDGTALRSLRIQEYLRRGLTSTVKIQTASGELIPVSLTPETVAQIRKNGPSHDDSLLWVARLYSIAWALHEPPALHVQNELGLARPTTSVWLRRARDRGFLTDPMDRPTGIFEDDDYALIRRVLDE